jgi:hypothetical protein
MIPFHLRPLIEHLMENDRYEAVLGILESACGTDPDDAETLAVMALMHFYLDNDEKTDELMDKAMNTPDPAPFEAHWIQAKIFLEAGYTEYAINIWQGVVDWGVPLSPYFGSHDDIDYMKSCVNDCRYMLSDTFYQLGKKHLAESYKKSFIRELEKGTYSRFDPGILGREPL